MSKDRLRKKEPMGLFRKRNKEVVIESERQISVQIMKGIQNRKRKKERKEERKSERKKKSNLS